MAAQPDYINWRTSQYLDQQADKEAAQDRLNRQVEDELRKRDTWVDGFQDLAASERPTLPSAVIDDLMAGDTAQAGHLIHKYITERYAVQQAEDAIEQQDEDFDNGFYV